MNALFIFVLTDCGTVFHAVHLRQADFNFEQFK